MNTNTGNADIKGQEAQIIEYLRTHKRITRADAWDAYKIANAPEIIRRLKVHGYNIGGEWVTNEETGKRHKEYFLAEVGA